MNDILAPASGTGLPMNEAASPSSPSVGIPDAYLAEMKRYVAAAKASRAALLMPDHFALCPKLFKALERNGARKVALFGVPVREYNGWSWGWALFVRDIYRGVSQFEPDDAPETPSVTATKAAEEK